MKLSLTALFLLALWELPWAVAGFGVSEIKGAPALECPQTCGLLPEGGPCLKRKRFRMWYYDSSTHECRRFSYGGCKRNKNRFWTEEECQATCGCMKIKQDDAILEREKSQADVCQMSPPDHGRCDKTDVRPLLKWTFNPSIEQCELFAYAGCGGGGSGNRFDSQHQCEEACGDQN